MVVSLRAYPKVIVGPAFQPVKPAVADNFLQIAPRTHPETTEGTDFPA